MTLDDLIEQLQRVRDERNGHGVVNVEVRMPLFSNATDRIDYLAPPIGVETYSDRVVLNCDEGEVEEESGG